MIFAILVVILSLIIFVITGILGFSFIAIILTIIISLIIMGVALVFGFSLVAITLALIPFLLLVGYFTGHLEVNGKRVNPWYIKK